MHEGMASSSYWPGKVPGPPTGGGQQVSDSCPLGYRWVPWLGRLRQRSIPHPLRYSSWAATPPWSSVNGTSRGCCRQRPRSLQPPMFGRKVRLGYELGMLAQTAMMSGSQDHPLPQRAERPLNQQSKEERRPCQHTTGKTLVCGGTSTSTGPAAGAPQNAKLLRPWGPLCDRGARRLR